MAIAFLIYFVGYVVAYFLWKDYQKTNNEDRGWGDIFILPFYSWLGVIFTLCKMIKPPKWL